MCGNLFLFICFALFYVCFQPQILEHDGWENQVYSQSMIRLKISSGFGSSCVCCFGRCGKKKHRHTRHDGRGGSPPIAKISLPDTYKNPPYKDSYHYSGGLNPEHQSSNQNIPDAPVGQAEHDVSDGNVGPNRPDATHQDRGPDNTPPFPLTLPEDIESPNGQEGPYMEMRPIDGPDNRAPSYYDNVDPRDGGIPPKKPPRTHAYKRGPEQNGSFSHGPVSDGSSSHQHRTNSQEDLPPLPPKTQPRPGNSVRGRR
ncbi:hypothetical protein OIY81_3147 [Cryptosporidium canis]|nr:hypothetical protein OIY81_3147 [Cryptosporidium canis]